LPATSDIQQSDQVNPSQQIIEAIKGVLPVATTNPFDTTKQAVGTTPWPGRTNRLQLAGGFDSCQR
jgi:hypothetical protein